MRISDRARKFSILNSQSSISEEVRAAIDEATGAGRAKRVCFAGVTGAVLGIDEMDWIFYKDGRERKVTLPRAAFTYEREFTADGGLVNFWLVETAEPLAKVFGIGDFVLGDDEVERHRRRMLATKEA